MRMLGVQALASIQVGESGRGIQRCHEPWCRSQIRLRSGVAVVVAQAGSCSSDSTPSLGTSIYGGCGHKKQKKKKKNNKKTKNYLFLVCLLQLGKPMKLRIKLCSNSISPKTPHLDVRQANEWEITARREEGQEGNFVHKPTRCHLPTCGKGDWHLMRGSLPCDLISPRTTLLSPPPTPVYTCFPPIFSTSLASLRSLWPGLRFSYLITKYWVLIAYQACRHYFRPPWTYLLLR